MALPGIRGREQESWTLQRVALVFLLLCPPSFFHCRTGQIWTLQRVALVFLTLFSSQSGQIWTLQKASSVFLGPFGAKAGNNGKYFLYGHFYLVAFNDSRESRQGRASPVLLGTALFKAQQGSRCFGQPHTTHGTWPDASDNLTQLTLPRQP